MKCQYGHITTNGYCTICGTGKTEKKKPKPLRKVSKKRIEENKEYSAVAKKYLELFPICEVENCDNKSEQIHHVAGRLGNLLTDTDNFLAVCGICHQYIELNPLWAKEHGYSKTRL